MEFSRTVIITDESVAVVVRSGVEVAVVVRSCVCVTDGELVGSRIAVPVVSVPEFTPVQAINKANNKNPITILIFISAFF